MPDIRSKCEKARNILVDNLAKEILGPGSENCLPERDTEIITDYPENRYYVGVLYPQDNAIKADNDEIMLDEETDDKPDDEQYDEPVADEFQEKVRRRDESINGDLLDDTLDEAVILSTQNRPSSLGMTFLVKENITHVVFNVNFATYRKTKWEECLTPYRGHLTQYDIDNSAAGGRVYLEEGFLKLCSPLSKKEAWQIWESDTLGDIELKEPLFKLARQCGKLSFRRMAYSQKIDIAFSDKEIIGLDNVPFIKIMAVKNAICSDRFAITVMLVNLSKGKYDGTNTIFQPRISISSIENDGLHFVPYENSNSMSEDTEELSLALLYRNRLQYATGHGTATNWDINDNAEGIITTETLPINLVPQMDFDYALECGVNKKSLSMKFLSDLDETPITDKVAIMKQLVNAYGQWIDRLKKVVVEPRLEKIAMLHIIRCEEAMKRMHNGLRMLLCDNLVMNSFQLANRAMFMQLIHREIQKEDKYPGVEEIQNPDYYQFDKGLDKYCWRPFQLAFLLMSLGGVTYPKAEDREILDLIWFPTGGGKTEAYLGLTAYMIFYRRLMYPNECDGTVVVMRYTLRLLTSQQFSRASTLICACEYIRKACEPRRSRRLNYPKYSLGKEPITIGLWIGGDHTPNLNCGDEEHKGAREFLAKLTSTDIASLKEYKDKYNKFQVLKCPWCGTKLVKNINDKRRGMVGDWGYAMQDNKHFYLHCTQEGCEFAFKLPIQVVDEELYRNPPTLLFATVDKFAMLSWKEEVGNFFASGSNNRTPELIIQDELHLISGPLGSIVGLYETAIDALCCAKGVRPKIIASTATIRRAEDQCWNLYNREVRQFPSPGLDASDSFFAKEASLDKKPGRMYLGILPAGKTKAMLQSKIMSTLLQYTHMLPTDDIVKDQYWTLTAYFNSLRDLGKCSGLVDDDIKDFIKRLCRRLDSERIGRFISTADELTSRISTTKLNETLDKLENLNYSKENQGLKKYASNVLLATNMISVGVDVARLNLMTVIGQPKLTSEYIQATSRVGRINPGLVCVLYDATKSRDRSHYEQFQAYHKSFYRFVEPTSVTPYSMPARDRALHASIIGIIRHRYLSFGLQADRDAQNFDCDQPYTKEVEEFIASRIKSIFSKTGGGRIDDLREVSAEIKAFWKDWVQRMESAEQGTFYYGERFMVRGPGANERRLIRPFGSNSYDASRDTLTSMRNVDKSIASHILVWGEDVK